MGSDDWHDPTAKDFGSDILTSTELDEYVLDNLVALYGALVGDAQATSEVIHRHKVGTWAAKPSAGEAGRLYRTTDEGDITIIDSGGKWQPIAVSVLDRQRTPVVCSDTTDETTIYTYDIPGGILASSGAVRLSLGGTYLNNAAAGTTTLQFKVKLGATTALTSSAVGIIKDPDTREWALDIWFVNATTDSQLWSAKFSAGYAGGSNFGIVDVNVNPTILIGVGYGTSGEDTSSAKTIAVTATHGGQDPATSIVMRMATLEILPPA